MRTIFPYSDLMKMQHKGKKDEGEGILLYLEAPFNDESLILNGFE